MKNFLSLLVIAFLTLGRLQAAVPLHNSTVMELPPDGIHPRIVNRLIKAAAEEWDMSVGQARQAYNQGALTFWLVPEAGPHTYMVAYDGSCILVAIEDVEF